MSDIRIHRKHTLGLARAREVAWQWAEEAEHRFDMECTVLEGQTSDTVEFTRSGVRGQLIVAADHFDLEARLGLLLGAFSRTIESEIQKTLDSLLARGAASTGKARRAAAREDGHARAVAPADDRGRAPAPAKAPRAAASRKK